MRVLDYAGQLMRGRGRSRSAALGSGRSPSVPSIDCPNSCLILAYPDFVNILVGSLVVPSTNFQLETVHGVTFGCFTFHDGVDCRLLSCCRS